MSDDEHEDDDVPKAPLKGLPTIDHEAPPPEVDYRDWSPETTKVVSGPAGPEAQYPGRRFRNKAEAKAYWEKRAGKIIEDLSLRNRYIYRVRRDA